MSVAVGQLIAALSLSNQATAAAAPQPALAADRVAAREIVRILAVFAAPRRQLKRKTLARNPSSLVSRSSSTECFALFMPSGS
jgi:hypothetical protein